MAGSTKDAGIARIPIDRAMDILAQTGLPEPARLRKRAQSGSRVGIEEGRPAGRQASNRGEIQAMKTTTKLSSAIVIAVLGVAGSRRRSGRLAPSRRSATWQRRAASTRSLAPGAPDLRFRDEEGREIRLGDYLGRRPVILALVYYRCPLLCNQVLNGLTRSLKAVSLDAGSDFDVVAVSINPEETPELARPEETAYLERYDRPGAERGWHFLVGDWDAIADTLPRPRVPLQLQSPDEALRPCRGHRGPHARRPDRAILLRDRLPSQGAGERDQAGGRRADRIAASAGCCCSATTTTPRPASTRFRSSG